MTAVKTDIVHLRRCLARALGIRVADFASRCQPISFKLYIGAYALNELQILPRIGIAQLFGKHPTWVNFAIASVDQRLRVNHIYYKYVNRVITSIRTDSPT